MADEGYKFQSDERSERKNPLNFNTLVGIIALAAITWVGNKTATTAETVTEIKTSLPYMTQSISDLRGRVGDLVTRSELEAKTGELKSQIEILNGRILKLEYGSRKPEP